MQNIYDTFNTATKGITAYAIMKDGKYIAKIVFKRVSSVTCYLHVLGHNMVSGKANGGGYDMCTASAAHAADKLRVTLTITEDPAGRQIAPCFAERFPQLGPLLDRRRFHRSPGHIGVKHHAQNNLRTERRVVRLS